mgnify:FL=1
MNEIQAAWFQLSQSPGYPQLVEIFLKTEIESAQARVLGGTAADFEKNQAVWNALRALKKQITQNVAAATEAASSQT